MTIKLIALDLDGTLLTSKKELSTDSKEILERAAEEGIEVVISTGRPLCGVFNNIRSIKGLRYIIYGNGAAIYDLKEECELYQDCMDLESSHNIIEEIAKFDVLQDVFVEGQPFVDASRLGVIELMNTSDEVKDYLRKTRVGVESLLTYIKESKGHPQKIAVNFKTNEDGILLHRNQVVEITKCYPQFVVVSGAGGNVEITNTTATKGNALVKLAELLGISVEETMAVGDSENDLDMIQKAGFSVAMANSEESVLESADFITKSNDEEGVAFALQQILEKK